MPIVAQRELIGNARKMKVVLDQVATVAPVDCAVLIQGETGTGKELIARGIHNQSRRAHGPFVTLNCAAIPAGLLESELFGHERGAYTGALTARTGRFQLAHQGTLFLDEIGDLPLELQPKLLRVLQEQEIEKLGSSHSIRVDVRIVAATHQNLQQMVADRRFRADLFYRLNVFPISLPPLRERSEDIPLLVNHFVREFSRLMNKPIDMVPDHVMACLCSYSWPGNVRELQHFIERAVLLTRGRELQPPLAELTRMVPAGTDMSGAGAAQPAGTLAEIERSYIAETLRQTNWVVGGPNGAAARLGLPRTTLISRIHKLGISRDMPSARVTPITSSPLAAAAGHGGRWESVA